MTRINTNISSLTAQHSLRKSNDALGSALTRLSTGLRINTGKDDPAGLIASEQLRSEITSIGQSIKNSERAGNIIATADAALGEVSSLLNDVRTLVQSSANKGAVSADEIAANQVQVDNALDAITRIAQTTVFGGQKLLNGTKSFSVSGTLGAFNSPSDITVNSFDPTLHTASAANDVSLTVTTQATKKSVTLKGTDFNTGTSNSLLDLSRGTSTSTVTTLVGNDFNLSDATSSLGSLSTGSTRFTRVIEGGAGGLDDLAGTGGETVTFSITGNLGTQTSVSVNVAAMKADSAVLVNAINAHSETTGVWASGSGAGGDVTLVSTLVGTTGTTATLTATGSTGGTETTRTLVGGANFTGMDGDATETITFDIVTAAGTTSVSVLTADLKADSDALVDAINNAVGAAGVTASSAGGAGATVTLTNSVPGTGTITVNNVAGTGGGDLADFTAAIGAGTQTLGVTDTTEFNAAITASGAGTAGTDGVIGTKTTSFTITGNKGSASISTAALSLGGLTGNDVIINNNQSTDTGLQALADLINTRTNSTGVIASVDTVNHNVLLTSQGVGSTSTASISASGGDASLVSDSDTQSTVTGSNGTSNTTTLELIGDLGRSVITVSNDAVINDSTVLRNAINAVTNQTGITANGGGFGADVVLSASTYGSAGIVTLNALAASNSADITLVNDDDSRVVTTGVDATGTISHGKGGGTFTAQGERFSYTDAAISLEGNLDPSLSPSVTATTTIQDTTAGAGGIDSLTGSGAQTISFQLTGVVDGNQVTTTISNVNVAALKADSRVLVDLINATSSTSGVRASTSGVSGNLVLSSTTPGANGSVAITATGSTNGTDHGVFNNSDTFTATTAGSNPATANNFDVTGGALFQIGPTVNFANQINVNITSLDLETLGRDYSATGNYGLSSLKSGGGNQLSSADLGDAAEIVTQAIQQVATLRGKLGAIQKNAIDSNIRSLQTSLEQVTTAESSIRDADFAVETANLTRSQILVQAGTSVLALANQSPQNVLALLQG